MLLVIVRNADNLVVGVAEDIDPGVIDISNITVEMPNHHFTEIQTQAEWNTIRDSLRTIYRWYRWEESAPGVITQRVLDRWWAVQDTRDGTICATAYMRNGGEPDTRPWQRLVEITQADFELIGMSLTFDGHGGARWSLDQNDNIVANTDSRLRLVVAATPVQVPSGSPVTIDLEIRNAAGGLLNFTGNRQVSIATPDGTVRKVVVAFTAGAAQVQRTLSDGVWSIVSDDPTAYRVEGDHTISVMETW